MIPKIIGYNVKELVSDRYVYWKKSCVGYVYTREDAGVFTVRDLKASDIYQGLRYSLKHAKLLRLVPVYAKEAV